MLKFDFSCEQKETHNEMPVNCNKKVNSYIYMSIAVLLRVRVSDEMYQALCQHVEHHRGSDVIADHYSTKWDSNQMAGFPLRHWSSGTVSAQQLIVG